MRGKPRKSIRFRKSIITRVESFVDTSDEHGSFSEFVREATKRHIEDCQSAGDDDE